MWPSFSVTVAINCGINGRSYVSSLILEAIRLEKSKNITLYNLLRDVQCVFVCVCEGEKGWEHVRWRSVSVRSVWVWEVLVGQKDESCVVIPGSLWISGLCPEPLCDAASLVSNTLKVEARVLLLLNGTEEIWRTWRFPHVFWIMDQKLEAIWQRLVTYNPPVCCRMAPDTFWYRHQYHTYDILLISLSPVWHFSVTEHPKTKLFC